MKKLGDLIAFIVAGGMFLLLAIIVIGCAWKLIQYFFI